MQIVSISNKKLNTDFRLKNFDLKFKWKFRLTICNSNKLRFMGYLNKAVFSQNNRVHLIKQPIVQNLNLI